MKKVISSLLLLCVLSNVAMADCDFSSGITPGPNKTFIYSEECHQQVGKLVQSNKTKDLQIADLNKAIELKDLALVKADERIQLWMTTTQKLEDRMTTIDDLRGKNYWMYYGLGIATGFVAVWAAGQLH